MATAAEIQDQALSRIGEPAQASNTPAATAIALHYTPTLLEIERAHRWNFLITRVLLAPDWQTPSAIADNGSGLYRVTKATHGLTTGNRVTFDASDDFPGTNYRGIQTTWTVTVINANTFDLDDSTFYGSGTVDTRYSLAPAFDWKFSVPAPSNMLRALGEDDGQNDAEPRWIYEGQRILTDQSSMRFFYLKSETDAAIYGDDPNFVQVLVVALALKIIVHLRGSDDKIAALRQELVNLTAPLARRIDAAESRSRPRLFPNQSGFVRARFGNGDGGWWARLHGLDIPPYV